MLYKQMVKELDSAKDDEKREEIRKNWALTSENFEENTVFKAHQQMDADMALGGPVTAKKR